MAAPRERSVKTRCSDVSNTERGIEESPEIGRNSDQLTVDPLTLPFLPLGDRKSLPKKVSAIYFAISGTNEVLYIGRAICLHTRWNGQKHHKKAHLEKLGHTRIAWLVVNNQVLLPDIEDSLINHFSPSLNKINNARRVNGKSKNFQIRLSDKEWERLQREAKLREIPASQLFREFLKQLDKEPQPN